MRRRRHGPRAPQTHPGQATAHGGSRGERRIWTWPQGALGRVAGVISCSGPGAPGWLFHSESTKGASAALSCIDPHM